MKNPVLISLKLLLVMTVLTGVLYPAFITALSTLLFPNASGGSMVQSNGAPCGSRLLGQAFSSDKYFHGRPSAVEYSTQPSGGSNLAPTSDSLRRLVESMHADFIRSNLLDSAAVVPTDMLFASASGLDPHISLNAALLQVDRVARARGLKEVGMKHLLALVNASCEKRVLGFIGQPRINVLLLNLALDAMEQ